jgi:hypothetical protein
MAVAPSPAKSTLVPVLDEKPVRVTIVVEVIKAVRGSGATRADSLGQPSARSAALATTPPLLGAGVPSEAKLNEFSNGYNWTSASEAAKRAYCEKQSADFEKKFGRQIFTADFMLTNLDDFYRSPTGATSSTKVFEAVAMIATAKAKGF